MKFFLFTFIFAISVGQLANAQACQGLATPINTSQLFPPGQNQSKAIGPISISAFKNQCSSKSCTGWIQTPRNVYLQYSKCQYNSNGTCHYTPENEYVSLVPMTQGQFVIQGWGNNRSMVFHFTLTNDRGISNRFICELANAPLLGKVVCNASLENNNYLSWESTGKKMLSFEGSISNNCLYLEGTFEVRLPTYELFTQKIILQSKW